MKPDPISLEDFFYGTATLGERGQIVVPAEARKDCDINPGDKVLVFRHPLHAQMLILAKVGQMQQLMHQMARALEQASRQLAEAAEDDEPAE